MHGWNKHVKEAHQLARADFQHYVLCGRPNSGPIFERMCTSRKLFKSRLKYCINNQEQIKMDILASQHSAKKFNKFWSGTKKLNSKMKLPVSVDGVSDQGKIANIFRDNFIVQSSVLSVREVEYVYGQQPIGFSAKDVFTVVKNMKRGKSPGHDGLSIEHLQHAGPHLWRVLAMLFTLCLRHSYLPKDLMKTIVVPIVKNPTGDLSDKLNYRPISLATVMAKVLDGLMDKQLDIVASKLQDSQFGFRAGLSTESAILALKHTVNYYVKRKTPVYACFLDFSRAFDMVSYNRLWTKLEDAGVCPEVIKIFSYWYSNQANVVRWGNSYSDEYYMKCGVRQGGLTSPRLFNIYVNDLIGELSNTHVGCFVDDVCVNNLSYADDMVLLSPSIGGLRKLLRVCESYALAHGLKYNAKKSEFMLFKSNNKGPSTIPPLTLNAVTLNRVTQFKYLGHVLTENMCDDLDIERERRALSVRGNMLAQRFARCTAEVKITLFKAYCQTFYTSSLWANFTQKSYNALRVQYNNIFRALFRLPRYCSASGMFADASVDDFYALMRKKVASLVNRVRWSSNRVLRMVGDRLDSALVGRFIKLHVTRYQ